MLKKSITYTDLSGETVTEDFYFHLSKADLVEMEMSHKGGMSAFLQRIAKSEDGKAIISEFKNLILGAYGQKSDDGRRFIKSEALREEFMSSEAYSALFFELCTDANAAAEFVNGIVPPNLDQEMAAVAKAEQPMHNESMAVRRNVFENDRVGDDPGEPVENAPRVLSHAEATEMDADELRSGLATGRYTFR